MICNYCHGESDLIMDKCKFCGCDRELSNAKDPEEYEKLLQKASPYINIASRFLLPYLLMMPIFAFAMIMMFIFGDDPDNLFAGFLLLVILATIAVLVYGTYYQIRHYKRLHRPSTKIVTGELVDIYHVFGHRVNMFVVEFEVNGNKYRCVNKNKNDEKLEIGQKIDIAYNYHNPHNCFPAKDNRGFIMIAITLTIVVVFGGIGIYLSNQLSGGPLLKS